MLFGGPANDQLSGGSGNDTLHEGAGDDSMFGGPGADNLFGEEGADFLFGGDDNDLLVGGLGDDSLNGAPGNDTIESLVSADGADFFSGGDGVDTASYRFRQAARTASRATTRSSAASARPVHIGPRRCEGLRDLTGSGPVRRLDASASPAAPPYGASWLRVRPKPNVSY
jgi:hypothetical protein